LNEKINVLIADDDRVILTTLAEGLESAGYSVVRANGGRQAIELSVCESPALAVLDIRMPDIDGIQVAQFLKENTEIPFIFLSAYGDEDTVKLAVEEGALGYLVKPIDVPHIIPTIESALKRSSEILKLSEDKKNLHVALSKDRSISVATGLIMERYHLSEQEAFRILRCQARSNRRKLDEFAKDLVFSAEKLNQFDLKSLE